MFKNNDLYCTLIENRSLYSIVPNAEAIQKIQIPEIRQKLQKLHNGPESEFDTFLEEHFFDLHYHVDPGTKPIQLGIGNLWRLAIDHPTQVVPPCIYRAPKENSGNVDCC